MVDQLEGVQRPPAALAVGVGGGLELPPMTRPSTRPTNRLEPGRWGAKAPVTSLPLSRIRVWCTGTVFGTRTAANTSPPLTASGRAESDSIVNLSGDGPAAAPDGNTASNASVSPTQIARGTRSSRRPGSELDTRGTSSDDPR